jgi:choline dehydrogenase-like flavoprotein
MLETSHPDESIGSIESPEPALSHAAFEYVIVGGGAGGLELAMRLGRRFAHKRVLLVDRSRFHIWKPTLHELAAGTLDSAHEGLNYPVLARRGGFTFALGELVDAASRRQPSSILQQLFRHSSTTVHAAKRRRAYLVNRFNSLHPGERR